VAPKSLLAVGAAALAALAGLAACSDDDGGSSPPTTDERSGCAVAPGVVEEAVGHGVDVERRPSGPGSCAYVGGGDASAGARVEVAVRSLDDEPFAEVLAAVEQRSGPTVVLPAGLVEGADRGWVAAVGRAVQLGAARGQELVLVSVVDPLLDAAAAEEVAGKLAGEVLSG